MSDGKTDLSRRVPAGLVDAGLSSLATFAVGVAAAQLFDASTLGVYAVFFTSHQLGLVLPMFLIYLPAEVRAVAHEMTHRLAILRSSLPIGLLVSLFSLVSIALAILVIGREADATTLAHLAYTAMIPTILMPAQAHIRRMLHIAGHSWRAASISVVQLITAVAALAFLIVLGVPDAAVPFGAFGIAAFVSLTAGIVLVIQVAHQAETDVHWRDLAATGRWLLVTGMAPNLAGFAVAGLIGNLAGTDALGYAEGARLAAQPLMVLGVGLNASLGPRSMEAGYERDSAKARHVARLFLVIIGAATIGYLAFAGGAWPWNPLAQLVPQAYEVAGLTALAIVASAIGGAVLPNQRELYGGGYERRLALVDVVANMFGILVATTASITGAFARPMSLGASNIWRGAHYQRALRQMYDEPGPGGPRAKSVNGTLAQENARS